MWPALPGVGVGGLLFAPGSLPMGPLSTAISEYLLLPRIPTTQEPLLTLLLIKQLVSEFNPIFTPGEIEGTRVIQAAWRSVGQVSFSPGVPGQSPT